MNVCVFQNEIIRVLFTFATIFAKWDLIQCNQITEHICFGKTICTIVSLCFIKSNSSISKKKKSHVSSSFRCFKPHMLLVMLLLLLFAMHHQFSSTCCTIRCSYIYLMDEETENFVVDPTQKPNHIFPFVL